MQGDQKLTLESAYFNAISGQGNEVGCKSFAFGVSPVFGAHVRLFEKLDIAAQLQVKTVMKYEVKEVTGSTLAAGIGVTDGKTFHSDLPTALNLGVGYRVIDPLYVSTSFNYYFNKSADCDTVIGTSSYDDSFEIAAGADYTINDFVLVSAGLAYGKQGTKSSANNVFNPILDSFQIGFGADIKDKNKQKVDDLLQQVLPQDFIKFGLIPEFIGRVPINVSLKELTEDDMIRILREPKNSLTKQYEALFKMDGVKLHFEEDALREIAKKSIERKTGARGLRAIVENVMMDYMYHVPSDESITEITVTKEMVDDNLLLIDKDDESSVVSIEDKKEKSA